jgi:hypothetical protein
MRYGSPAGSNGSQAGSKAAAVISGSHPTKTYEPSKMLQAAHGSEGLVPSPEARSHGAPPGAPATDPKGAGALRQRASGKG